MSDIDLLFKYKVIKRLMIFVLFFYFYLIFIGSIVKAGMLSIVLIIMILICVNIEERIDVI